MQFLFDYFGTSIESQGIGNQNLKRLPLDNMNQNEWQEKAAAFLKILSDCSPETELDIFGHEMEGQTEIISSGMTANMPGLSPPNAIDILQKYVDSHPSEMQQNFPSLTLSNIANEIPIDRLLNKNSDSDRNEQADANHLLTALFFTFKHNFRHRVQPNKDAPAESEATNEIVDNPISVSSNPAVVPGHILSVNLTEQMDWGIDENGSTYQSDDEITALEKLTNNVKQNSNVNFIEPKASTTYSASIETSEQSKHTEPFLELTADSGPQKVDESIQKESGSPSADNGPQRSSLFSSMQDSRIKSDLVDVSTSSQFEEGNEDSVLQLPGTTGLHENESVTGQNPAHRAAYIQPIAASTNMDAESPALREEPADIELEFKKYKSNSQENSSGNENKNHDQNNPGTNKENGQIVFKDNSIPKKAVFRKFEDNDILKSEIPSTSDSVKQGEIKQSQANPLTSKQPDMTSSPSLNQSQFENRISINAEVDQGADFNATLENNKETAKIGSEKNTNFQPDPIRSGATTEERTDVIRQIVQHMNYRQFGSRSQMVVHLKPESLGRLRMQIETENQQVTVKMISDSNNVKEMIEQHLHTLKHELREHGLEVQKIDVTVQSESDQQRNGQPSGSFYQSAHQKESRQKRQRANQPESQSGKESSSVADTNRIDSSDRKNDSSEVDYFV